MARAPIRSLLVVMLICFVQAQQSLSERETILSALALSYGQPSENRNPVFAIAETYILTPSFAGDGTLVKISIDPKFGPGNTSPLSRSQFEAILVNLNSIKPLGAFEESPDFTFVLGARASRIKRYEHGYLQTAEPITDPAPGPVAFAHIYYLHPVTGAGKVPPDLNPEYADSFGMVCFNAQAYIAPKPEFLKFWRSQGEQVTLELAGPTGDTPPMCHK